MQSEQHASAVELHVAQAAGWAPGVHDAQAWAAWASRPFCPVGDEAPKLEVVPALARRRLERLGRVAFEAALGAAGARRGLPLVVASRHGEAHRSVALLGQVARAEPLSPASFALSVHNAIAGQWGILRQDTAPTVCLANGPFTIEAAFIEAAGLVADGHDEVLLLAYDASWPSVYAPFRDEPDADFAWCWRLTKQKAGPSVRLERRAAAQAKSDVLPHALEVWRFFLSTDAALEVADGASGWAWSRA